LSVAEEMLVKSLGRPSTQWHFADGKFHVLQFRDQPVRGATTYASIGLSDVPLMQPAGQVREEFLFAAWSKHGDLGIPEGLACLAGERVLARRPFLDGEAIGPVGWLGRGVRVNSLLALSPRYFPAALSDPLPLDPPGNFVWLVPITEREAQVVNERSSGMLEEAFEKHDPDLLNLNRRSVF
jgi:hypothetical protein